MDNILQPLNNALAAFASMPDRQLWLVVAALLLAVVAGNGVFALHCRRVGKPVWRSLLDPSDFPLLHFNRREWLLLGAVFLAFFGLLLLALRSGPGAEAHDRAVRAGTAFSPVSPDPGHRMDTTDPDWYLLRNAVYTGEFEEAEALLRRKPALLHLLNTIGETVLHFLAVENDRDGVAWLRARGADIDTWNEFGTPVVFEVASLGYKDLFLWFVESGVDLRATDAEDRDLVSYLLDYEQDEMAEWVRRHGA